MKWLRWLAFLPSLAFADVGYVSFTDLQGDNGTDSEVVAVPTHTDGDFLLLPCHGSRNATLLCNVVTGWTDQASAEIQDNPGNFTDHAFFRLSTREASSEPSDYTVTWPNSRIQGAAMISLSGVDTSDPIDDIQVSARQNTDATPATPAITTTLDGAMVIHFLVLGVEGNGVDNITPPSGTTLIYQEHGFGGMGAAAYEIVSTAGTVAAKDWTMTGSDPALADSYVVSVALNPDVVAPPSCTAVGDVLATVGTGSTGTIDTTGSTCDEASFTSITIGGVSVPVTSTTTESITFSADLTEFDTGGNLNSLDWETAYPISVFSANATFNSPITGFSGEVACVDPSCPDDSLWEETEITGLSPAVVVGDRYYLSDFTGVVNPEDFNDYGSYESESSSWTATLRFYDDDVGAWRSSLSVEADLPDNMVTVVFSPTTLTVDGASVTATLSAAFSAGGSPTSVSLGGNTIACESATSTTCVFSVDLADMVPSGDYENVRLGAHTATVTNGTEVSETGLVTLEASSSHYAGVIGCSSCPAGSLFEEPSFPSFSSGDDYYLVLNSGSFTSIDDSGNITGQVGELTFSARVYTLGSWTDPVTVVYAEPPPPTPNLSLDDDTPEAGTSVVATLSSELDGGDPTQVVLGSGDVINCTSATPLTCTFPLPLSEFSPSGATRTTPWRIAVSILVSNGSSQSNSALITIGIPSSGIGVDLVSGNFCAIVVNSGATVTAVDDTTCAPTFSGSTVNYSKYEFDDTVVEWMTPLTTQLPVPSVTCSSIARTPPSSVRKPPRLESPNCR